MKTEGNKVAIAQKAELFEQLARRMQGYTPELASQASPVAGALSAVFVDYMSHIESGINQLPLRQSLAYFDMLGMHLLPATAARAPLIFRLMDDSPVDVPLSAGSLVAAVAQPALPSLNNTTGNKAPASEQVLFGTEQSFVLCRANLKAVYSIDPRSDEFTDHSQVLEKGFTFFDDMQLTEHAIYLGHDSLFKIGGDDITLLLQITFATPVERKLKITWQYLTDQGWLSLDQVDHEDTTRGLKNDGQIALRRACGPDAKKETFFNRTSYWVRGVLKSPLVHEQTTSKKTIPVFNDFLVRIQFSKKNLLPESAFADIVSLDTSKDFYPFGRRPELGTTFYLASKEVFQRAGAFVKLAFDLSIAGTPTPVSTENPNDLKLAWEFFNGNGWATLGIEPDANLTGGVKFIDATTGTKISFLCPTDWQQSKVNGVENYWLRVRISSGGYGVLPTTALPAGKPQPPVVKTLTLAYSYITNSETLDHCLVRNNFVFEDQTEGCRWPDQTFTPFQPVSDEQPTIHFGFDHPLPSGLVSLYADVIEQEDALPMAGSQYIWEYRNATGWSDINVIDETQGFIRSGMIQFIGAPDAIATPGLGGDLYRIRARLKQGVQVAPAQLNGLWFNAAWVHQRAHYEQELLGMSDGNPNQSFQSLHQPVLVNESLEIQEWSGQGEGWKLIANEVPESELRYVRDPETSRITSVWVKWRNRTHFYDALVNSRCYVLERATGLIQFGDSQSGMVPPAGSRMILSYDSGGGVFGNIPANGITELRMIAPYVMSATNPVQSSGGANLEPTAEIRQRGPQQLRHRDRAISASDLEWVAHDASPEVARASCLSLQGPAGHAQRGWVTLLIVPKSQEAKPQLQPQLRSHLMAYINARAPTALVGRIRILGPSYIPINISAEITPVRSEDADLIGAKVRARLDDFLHPLTGGSNGEGWRFGQNVYKSQIAALIEATPGVDYVQKMTLLSEGRLFDDFIAIPPHALVCTSQHELKLTVGVP